MLKMLDLFDENCFTNLHGKRILHRRSDFFVLIIAVNVL